MPIPRRRSFPAGAMRPRLLCGISTGFPVLSPCGGQVAYALLTRAPVAGSALPHPDAPRLACVKPAASVHPEPGSNSPLLKLSAVILYLSSFLCSRSAERPTPAVTRTSLTEGHALSQFPSLLTLFLSHYLNVLSLSANPSFPGCGCKITAFSTPAPNLFATFLCYKTCFPRKTLSTTLLDCVKSC